MSLNITLKVTGFFSRASTPERRPHSQPSEFLGDVVFPAFWCKMVVKFGEETFIASLS